MSNKPMFHFNGVHGLVDGQFGSTGKGLYASYLAAKSLDLKAEFLGVLSNAGPNSGHTFYHNGEKHVLKQLPTFAVKYALMGRPIPAFLTAGAVINPMVLMAEALRYPTVPIYVHANAAVADTEMQDAEATGGSAIHAVAGTRSGTGAALARRIYRQPDAVFRHWWDRVKFPPNVYLMFDEQMPDVTKGRYFMEVSQGFSLGIGNSRFYPKVTSRECTIAQGIADAKIAPQLVKQVFMVIRTYPIRVGDADGFSSGGYYPDQMETTWERVGAAPELTTVTQRVRRVFTFSERQVREAVAANQPDVVLVNFMNYLRADKIAPFQSIVENISRSAYKPFDIEWGWGPNDNDITPF